MDCKVRDNFTCQICGRETDLEVHHICKKSVCLKEYGWSIYEANHKNNGITLCTYCHFRQHIENLWRKNIKMFRTIIASNSRG